MTFSDPVGWPDTPPAQSRARGHSPDLDAEFALPPLPTLHPLPALRPMTPMPRPPWEFDPDTVPAPGTIPAASTLGVATVWPQPAPPPPVGHPAARLGRPPEMPDRPPLHDRRHDADDDPRDAGPGEVVPGEVVPGRHAGADSALPVGVPQGPARPEAVVSGQAAREVTVSRQAPHRVPGLRVVVIGGAEPLGGMVAERLLAAGHRLAVHDVTIPADDRTGPHADPATFRAAEPISLSGDRSDSDDVVHTVARAEVALGGLDAIVVLPARQRFSTTLDADAVTWADEWSSALTTEVLAAACAAHIAARSFLARRRAGRIVLVANGWDDARSGALPTSVTRAAIGRLATDLTHELGPHGIGVSVVTTGPGGAQDFAMTQVADVVEALLATPVLSTVASQVG